MADTVYVVFAIISSVLVLLPLPWHFHSWNGGTCLIMIYAAMGCIICAVDKTVWADNVDYELPVWCDISESIVKDHWLNSWFLIATRVLVGLSVGLPAAALCLTRRLYLVASSPFGGSQTQVFTYFPNFHPVLLDLTSHY